MMKKEHVLPHNWHFEDLAFPKMKSHNGSGLRFFTKNILTFGMCWSVEKAICKNKDRSSFRVAKFMVF